MAHHVIPPLDVDGPTPPQAPRRPAALIAHGDERIDPWLWLRDRDDPEVIGYLEAENSYADAVLAPTEALQEQLFEQIKGRIQEDDVSVPARRDGWWYWSRTDTGRQYPAYCRLADPERRLDARTALAAAQQASTAGAQRPGDGEQVVEVILDGNALAGDSDYFSLGVFDISADHATLAYAVDLNGSERYQLRFRDLRDGRDLDDVIEEVTYGSAWSAEGQTLFYVRPDPAMRPYQVWRHQLGTTPPADQLVYQEDDERFFVSVGLTRSRQFVVIGSESKVTSEAHWIPADRPTEAPRVILPRTEGVEYDVEHASWPDAGHVWLIRTNAPDPTSAHTDAPRDGGTQTNFALYRAPVEDARPDRWTTVLAHRPDVMLEGVDAFAGHLVVAERASGLERLRVRRLRRGDEYLMEQPEPVYSLLGDANGEWDTTTFRFRYTSLVTPISTIDYDVEARERETVKTQPVLGGYRPGDYHSERTWASAADGTRVPVSLVARADVPRDGSAPCLLYGYGSYESTVDPTFSSTRLNLLERGWVFAIAHIRGGGELGRTWYEQGKLDHKRNTFTDFIACAEHLVAQGWTSPSRLVARGASAGGLLMGAVTNLRPQLWRAVVAEVPFVDVVTTMSDESLPLTVTEWEEWGNPRDDPAAYRYMKAYSPYDNIAPRDYPALYVTAGLNDPRVGFWEPAKWVAKLRATRTNRAPIVLRTELGAGHGGPSGRYDAWRDEARLQAFLLSVVSAS